MITEEALAAAAEELFEITTDLTIGQWKAEAVQIMKQRLAPGGTLQEELAAVTAERDDLRRRVITEHELPPAAEHLEFHARLVEAEAEGRVLEAERRRVFDQALTTIPDAALSARILQEVQNLRADVETFQKQRDSYHALSVKVEKEYLYWRRQSCIPSAYNSVTRELEKLRALVTTLRTAMEGL